MTRPSPMQRLNWCRSALDSHDQLGQSALVRKQRAEHIEIEGLAWDGGAPLPVLLATDHRTLFACYLPGDEDRVVVGEFTGRVSVRFGMPNDEVVHGHPCGVDLLHYGVHLVHNSTWLAELRQIESVHPQATKPPFVGARHYFLTFHDSSLEAVATELVVVGSYGAMADAVAEMIRIANPT